MRFIVDECTGPRVAEWLRKKGYEVFSVYEEARGITDEKIIAKANKENYVLLTNDKDFGELVVKQNKPHKGVILLRLKNEKVENKIEILRNLLEKHSEKITNNFIVVTEKAIRIMEKQ